MAFWDLFYKKGKYEPENIVDKDKTIQTMYYIDRPDPTEFFLNVRQMAGYWLQQELNKFSEKEWHTGAHWLKNDLTYPCFEHFSISYKNQIFCILIDIIDADTNVSFLPSKTKELLIENCIENNCIPCLYKLLVKNPIKPIYNTIRPISSGWNLTNAITNEQVFPEKLVSNDKIEMSNWELRDFAIQCARTYIEKEYQGKILSYQNILGIDPQLWFEDKFGKKNYVVVRSANYPQMHVDIPNDINSIVINTPSYQGYFMGILFKALNNSDKIYRNEGANFAVDKFVKI